MYRIVGRVSCIVSIRGIGISFHPYPSYYHGSRHYFFGPPAGDGQGVRERGRGRRHGRTLGSGGHSNKDEPRKDCDLIPTKDLQKKPGVQTATPLESSSESSNSDSDSDRYVIPQRRPLRAMNDRSPSIINTDISKPLESVNLQSSGSGQYGSNLSEQASIFTVPYSISRENTPLTQPETSVELSVQSSTRVEAEPDRQSEFDSQPTGVTDVRKDWIRPATSEVFDQRPKTTRPVRPMGVFAECLLCMNSRDLFIFIPALLK